MPRDVSLDNPAQQRAEDGFNRWPFSKRLADTIVSFDTSQGAPVLGLFGKWGYGKSTVLNFIKCQLDQEHAAKVVTFEFNPWLFKDQEALLKEFFAGLAATINQSLGSTGKTAGQILARYGGALQAIPVIGAGLGKAAEQLGKDLTTESLQTQRTRVIEIMRSAERAVVVLIDDLDRLERDDIMTVLKLVRLSANFPHVIYVLAFDDEMVARAAGEKYGGGTEWGRQFLEKIVQYPFSLPAIRPDRLVEFVLRRAKEACAFADTTLSDGDWELFREISNKSLAVRLATPRQAIRYANALRFALPMLKDEVDPLTQMLVEGLRTLFPEVYAFARNRYVTRKITEKETREILTEAMEGSDLDQVEAGYLLLDFLKNRDVFDPRYFDRSFSYAVDPADISERDVFGLLALADENKAEMFLAELRRMALTNAGQLLDALGPRVSQLDYQKTAFLIRMLAREGLIFAEGSDVLKDSLTEKTSSFLARVHSAQIKRAAVNSERRSQNDELALWVNFIRAEPLPLALRCVKALENIIGAGHPSSLLYWELAQAELSRDTKPFYLTLAPFDALRLLGHWAGNKPSEQMAWLNRRLEEHPEEAEAFLNLFVTGEFNYQGITDYVDAGVLSRSLTNRLNLQNQKSDQVSAGAVTWIEVARKFLSVYTHEVQAETGGDDVPRDPRETT